MLNNFTYISCMNEYLNDIGEKGRQIRLSGRFQGRFTHSAGERMTVMGKIRAILIGCGVVGSGIIMETYRRGVEYQGIFDVREEIIGKDFGETAGIEKIGCVISDVKELPEFLDSHEIDLAFITSSAPFTTSYNEIKILLSRGVNILTSLADIYAMEYTHPDVKEELDSLAKANGATYFASGIQDVFWTALPVALSGCLLEAEEIRGTNVALIDEFGPGVADECYVGWELEKFEEASAAGELPVNDFLIALYELAMRLGFHIVSEESRIQPILAKEDVYYPTIDRHVKKGRLIGNEVVSTVKTEEGTDLVCYFVSKMSEEGDTDVNKWEIKGKPSINVITDRMQGEITTGSNMINRIPDVINAPAGVISAGEMVPPSFKHGDLSQYVK